ncbi:MAG: FkbM family methyltransferase [Candidatus Liptonbacteria bacterium]|nr:FkbM family methyltransferase [Candidatus Liptonbacteria bacterium]
MKDFLRRFFVKTVKFMSRGWGLSRFAPVAWVYGLLYSPLKSKGGLADVSIPGVGNLKFALDEKDSLGLSVFGIYEEYETSLFVREIKPGGVVVDAGANIGYYTVIASRLTGENGRVYAFEPDPVNFGILKKNVEQNGCKNVILENKALSDKNGTINLYVSGENMGDHRIYDSGDGRKSVPAQAIRLDDYLGDVADKVNLLKMDVQGAEIMVLRGAERVLGGSGELKIFSEFWPFAMKRAGENPKDFFEILGKKGFAVSDISATKSAVEPIQDTKRFADIHSGEKDGGANIFAEKK